MHPRLDFYTMYKREATEHDMEYVKKYDEDLNTTLIFVRYFGVLLSVTLPGPTGGLIFRRQFGICY